MTFPVRWTGSALAALRSGFGAWLLLGLAAGLVLIPVAALFYGAIRTDSPRAPGATFTLANLRETYLGLVVGGGFQEATVNSVMLAIPVALFATTLGVALAWLVGRTDLWGKHLFEVGFLVPLFFSPLVGLIAWTMLAAPGAGYINLLWREVGGAPSDLVDVYSYPGIVWVMTIYFVPYVFIINVGALRAMDPALEHAAAAAGANLPRTITAITVPLMLPSIAASALLVLTLALEQFSIPGFLGTHIQYKTLAYSIYERVNRYPADFPGAAAGGTVLLLLAVVGVVYYRRLTRRAERYVTISGRGLRQAEVRLGRLRPIAALLCAAVFVAVAAAPLAAVLLRSLMRGRTVGVDLVQLGPTNFIELLDQVYFRSATVNSVFLAAATATVVVAAGLALALWTVRRKSRPVALADYLISMPIAIPGTVFGIGMLWAYVASPLYATIWVLLIAFAARYIVYGVRMLGSGLMQLDKSLEEAARTSGASPTNAFVRIDLALLRPIAISVWLFVFLLSMRELSASILLASGHSSTLPILTWAYLTDGHYGIASALAVVQLVLVGSIVAIFRLTFGVKLKTSGQT